VPDGAQVQPLQEGLDRQVPVEVEEEADSPPAAQAAQDAAKIEVAKELYFTLGQASNDF
jgi:hypothetical protein